MNGPRKAVDRMGLARGASALLGLVFMNMLVGCSEPTPWGATTVLRFEGLTEHDAPVVERVMQAQELTFKRTSDAPIEYEIARIKSAEDVGKLLEALREEGNKRRMDLPFERATFQFGGLAASGAVATTIKVQVSPGARAFIADGDDKTPWREVAVDSKGNWNGPVRPSAVVSRLGGWVYIAARRNAVTRFYRVSAITGVQEYMGTEGLASVGLPEPTDEGASSGVAAPKEEEKKETSGGFKWPWQK